MRPPPIPIKDTSSSTPPPTLPSPTLLFFLSQRMNCKSIQVFQQRCRVEEILLRFSRFFVFPPSSQSSPTLPPPSPTLHHPPLHLKNPMKPVECCRAFQHLFFFFFFYSPQRPAGEPGPRLLLSGVFFCSPFKGPVFLFIFSPPSLLPTSSFLLCDL